MIEMNFFLEESTELIKDDSEYNDDTIVMYQRPKDLKSHNKVMQVVLHDDDNMMMWRIFNKWIDIVR